MNYQRKRVAKRLASGLLAGAVAFGGLALSGASPVSAETPTTNRIAGVDRYDTSVALALATDATADHILIVSGENYPDALAASGYAGKLYSGANEESVILLTRSGALPESVINYLSNSSNLSSDAKVYIVGGTSVVSADVAAQVTAITGLTPTRVSGDTRYSTAVELSKKIGNSASAILVSGSGFADGVAASGWAYAADIPVLLAGPAGLDAATKAEFKRLVTATAGLKVAIVGGTSAVPDAAISDLVGEGVAYANISRIAGADRYATATALNVVMVGAGAVGAPAATFNGSKVALMTGENFADAIAAAPYLGKNATHTALVSSSGVPAGTAALVAAVAPTNPASLVAIGGYAAVSNTTLGAVKQAAADAAVFTPTITVAESAAASGATATMKIVKLPATVTNGDTCAVAACAATDTVSEWLGTESNYTINGINLSVFSTGGVSLAASAAGADATVTITLPNGFSSAGVVVGFAGIAEGKSTVATAGLGNTTFSIAAASATIADDATAPTVAALNTAANSDGTAYFVLSETATADLTKITVTDSALAAKCTAAAPADKTFDANSGLFECSDDNTLALAAGDIITFAADALTDTAGNKSAAVSFTVGAADTTVPTLTRTSVTPKATTASTFAISLTTGTLTLSSAAGSPMHGQGGIGWRVVLESISGNIPSVSVDSATKRITVSANFAKHTANDIINALAENSGGSKGLLTGGAGGDGGNKLNAAYISGDLVAPTVGNSTTAIVLTASEYIPSANLGAAAKFVNASCPQTATAPAIAADGVTITLTCDASATPFAGVIALGAAAVTDIRGNASAASAAGTGI